MKNKRYWLMKSEPETYSISDLQKDQTTWWEGVRNYQARNFMMKEMQPRDLVLFYHSNAEPPGIVGLAEVSNFAQPDKTQYNKKSEYFDPKATKEKPNWYCVEVKFVKKLKRFISLEELRNQKELKDLLVIKKGQRLSIQPVQEKDFQFILTLSEK